jgi:hypothetical protein
LRVTLAGELAWSGNETKRNPCWRFGLVSSPGRVRATHDRTRATGCLDEDQAAGVDSRPCGERGPGAGAEGEVARRGNERSHELADIGGSDAPRAMCVGREPHCAQTGGSIEFVVASVASRTRIPGFLVEEIAESRKSIHILCSSISITDTEVGARGQPLLWNRK